MRLGDIWTLRQATRFGFLAGFAALLLWPAFVLAQEPVRPIFVAALMLAAFCGVSILFMTIVDLLTVTRDRRILAARIFDLALGALLTLPPALALESLLR